MNISKFNIILSNSINLIFDPWRLNTNFLLAKVGLTERDLVINKQISLINLTFYLLLQLLIYIVEFIIFIFNLFFIKILYRLKKPIKIFNKDTYYLIDTYTLQNLNLEKDDILKGYFPGLLFELENSNKNYIVFPRLFDLKNVFGYLKYFKLIKSQKNILFDFDFIYYSDLFKYIKHLLIYPIQIVLLARELNKQNVSYIFIKKLIKSIRANTIYGMIRYYSGKRISQFLNDDSIIIQWSENQPFDICFNIGLRETNKNLKIIGTQLFLWPSELLNIHFYKKNIFQYPDKILVNGKYYINSETNYNFLLGPSFRYKKLFDTKVYSNKQGTFLILFSYFANANVQLINFLNKICLDDNVIVKFHPTNNKNTIHKLLKFEYSITDDNLYDLFKQTKLVIGNNSGSLVEAVACGIPVILNNIDDSIKFSYLPDYAGKGILFDESNFKDFESKKNHLLDYVNKNSEERLNLILKVRSEFFTYPSSEIIKKSFEF